VKRLIPMIQRTFARTGRWRAPATAMLAAGLLLLAAAGAYGAVIGLPADGSQVNNDPAAGIDPNQNAGASDVVGGSLAVNGPRIPWGSFEQQSGSSQQIFVRAFKNGQWITEGKSLNISPNVEAEAPSIDFAGVGRNVPWTAWYEPNSALGGAKQIFASRFNAAANTWIAEGQNRGSGVSSLNIHTDKEAENPSVAGGAAVPGNDPVPWVAWQEEDGNASGTGNHDQIFVSKGVKQAAANSPCTGFKPSDAASVSMFCWQQVGLDRLARDGGSSGTGDPTLNVDPSRDGVEPDITSPGQATRSPGWSGMSRTTVPWACVTTSRCSRPRSSAIPLPTVPSTGRPWATGPRAKRTSWTRPATASGRARGRRAPRTRAR